MKFHLPQKFYSQSTEFTSGLHKVCTRFVSNENLRFAHSLHSKTNHSLHMVCIWFAHDRPARPVRAHASGHLGHDQRLVIHSRNGAKPTSPHTCKLARFRPGLGTSSTARMHKPLGVHPQASPLPAARYCIEECLPNHPLFSYSTSHRSAVQPSEHCCPPACTTLGLPKAWQVCLGKSLYFT